MGKDDAQIVLIRTWFEKGAVFSEKIGASHRASSFFFNGGMTQAQVISLLIGSNQFLQELLVINVGLLRSHSFDSQQCPAAQPALLLPGLEEMLQLTASRCAPSSAATPACSEIFFFLSTFGGSGEICPFQKYEINNEIHFIRWFSVFPSSDALLSCSSG